MGAKVSIQDQVFQMKMSSKKLEKSAQKALKQETDDDCSRPRWVATEKALFGRKDRRPMCGYTSFAHPYAKRGPIARSYATTCAPPPSVTLPSLEKCVKGVVFARPEQNPRPALCGAHS